MPDSHSVSRRTALKTIPGATAGAALLWGGLDADTQTRSAASDGERERFNVGYYGVSGRREAADLADRLVRDFDIDAATIEADTGRARRLQDSDAIRYVERDWPVYALGGPINYGVDRTDADVAHAKGATGAGIDIAVIDTGVAPDHRALRPNLGAGADFVNHGAGVDGEPWRDLHGHGTHCAGLIGATGENRGVCTDATLHAIRAIGPDGRGRVSDAAAAIRHAGQRGWEVANLSFGTRTSNVLIEACRSAWAEGTTLVAAAGGPGMACPSRDPSCLAVGAVDRYDDLAPFSPTTGVVDLVAPGRDLRSTVPSGYDHRSGTSQACALVAGAVAQLLAQGYKGMEARRQLQRTASDLELPTRAQGDGLLDVAAALGYPSSDDLGGAEPS